MSNTNKFGFRTFVRSDKHAEATLKEVSFELELAVTSYTQLKCDVIRQASVVFGLEPPDCFTLAEQYVSDLIEAKKHSTAPTATKLGKLSEKKGTVTIKESLTIKGATITPAYRIVAALQWAAECGKYGFAWSKTNWQPSQYLIDAFAELGISIAETVKSE